jgi:nucleobase:cation symporter-1, NCS1 family
VKIETRCIEFIPQGERYGTPKRLFTIWFSTNMQVTALVVGALGITQGLDFASTITAILIGNALGSIFMAAHSAQGPHLGVPQMIQSRAQFGVIGAALPLLVVVCAYVLFSAANAVMMRETVKAFAPVADTQAIVIVGLVTLAISAVGYELIHKIGAVMSFVSLALFLAATRELLDLHHAALFHHGAALSLGRVAFWVVVAQAASWTLGFCTFVADYSRYLPEDVSDRSTFWYTYLGSLLGASAVMMFGALLAIVIGLNTSDPGTAVARLFPGHERVILILVLVGVIEINALNFYSAFIAAVTIFSGFRGMPSVSVGLKFVIVSLVCLVATVIAAGTQYHFDDYFADILNAQIYVLVPWSSINLVDYYYVKRGKYRIEEFFKANSIYGRVNGIAAVAFFAAVVCEIPFVSLSFYKGPIANWLGVDVAFVPALILSGLIYGYLMRAKSEKVRSDNMNLKPLAAQVPKR